MMEKLSHMILMLSSLMTVANKVSHGDVFFIAALPPLQSRAC